MGRKTTDYMDFVRSNKVMYKKWNAMKQRCGSKSHPEYKNYGARGIHVCEEWANSFVRFCQDMGTPGEGMSIDRIDNDGPYSKDNCRWATTAEQNRNKRCNRVLELNGVTMTLQDWANALGIHHQTLRNRLSRGWSVSEALSTGKVEVRKCSTTGKILPRDN